MTKKQLLPSIAAATISSLVFSNCATIANYRKDPSEWNTPGYVKPKVEKVSKKTEPKEKRGGIFGFFSKSRKDPKELNNTNVAPTVVAKQTPRAIAPVITTTPSPQPQYVKQPHVKQPRVQNYDTLPMEKPVQKTSSGIKKKRRTVEGLLTPDAGKLPTEKDLQEVESIPLQKSSSGVNIPVKP